VFSNTALEIEGAENLVLDARGATFVFYLGFGVSIRNCRNVTVRGLVLDADPPNYAQGVVTGVDLTAGAVVATFDDEFLMPDPSTTPFDQPGGSAGAKVMFWNATTRLPRYPVHFVNESLPAAAFAAAAAWRIRVQHGLSAAQVAVGDLISVFPRRGFTWYSYNSSGVTADGVTIHAGGNMGFLESMGDGGHVYRNVSIVRKPGSTGLMALNADGFHSMSVRRGPTLEDSEISFTGDDHLNIHASMLVVCKEVPGANIRQRSSLHDNGTRRTRRLAIVNPQRQLLRAGDTLSFYHLLASAIGHPPHGLNPLLARGVIQSVAVATDPALVHECQGASAAMGKAPYNTWLIVSTANSPVYVVDFEAPYVDPVVVQSHYNLVSVDESLCANAVVRRNHFHDSCGSGGRILLKSRNATFEGNVAARFGGVHVYTEQEWLEGDLGISNIALRDNVIEDQIGFAPHFDVMAGVPNVSCANSTFVERGVRTERAEGC
jgi:hypothetical protein